MEMEDSENTFEDQVMVYYRAAALSSSESDPIFDTFLDSNTTALSSQG